MKYEQMKLSELREELNKVGEKYEELRARGLKLNMTRGKPGREQLDIVADMLSMEIRMDDCVQDGVDARNYGEVSGLPCAKRLFSELLGCKSEECFIGGNSSLSLMYDVIARAFCFGLLHSNKPWSKLEKVRWLCPAPGYDRHFKITELFGFELVTVPMTPEGPDMQVVEELIKDSTVKGMWCVPKYSNPDGFIYSAQTVHRIAAMKPAAEDFLLMWDNAYCVHEFDGEFAPFEDIIALCREAGNPDMVFEFASTSKMTFPGAGVSVMAASVDNQRYISKLINVQTISYDKLNQLRHVMYLKDKAHAIELMKKHAQVLRPKFMSVLKSLDEQIAPLGIAQWQSPKGGYFVSVNTAPGLAKRTLELCKGAGVEMTAAGATFPYGLDPRDSNIRIAPSMPSVAELDTAMEVFCVCLRYAALEQLIKAQTV